MKGQGNMSTLWKRASRASLVGVGATATMDLGAEAILRTTGVPPLDYGLVGRWIGHMPRGQFTHDSIAAAASVPKEKKLGLVAHYCIGVGFASLLLTCEAVAQSPAELAGSVLSVGCENGHRRRHARAGRRDVGALNRAGAHFRERAAAFPKRLCATASCHPRWAERPTLGPALATGLGSTVASFVLMQPAFGMGLAASKTPTPPSPGSAASAPTPSTDSGSTSPAKHWQDSPTTANPSGMIRVSQANSFRHADALNTDMRVDMLSMVTARAGTEPCPRRPPSACPSCDMSRSALRRR
ncbi:MAG: DUF2938 family protein [Thermoleophilaceae bacterium]